MSYIDEAILRDEVAGDIVDTDDISVYSAAVDRLIEIECAKNSVRIDEIPVDGSGFTTSRVLMEFGILSFKKQIFQGYVGSSDGNGEDIYMVKYELIAKDLRDIKADLTRQSILGVFTESGEPKGRSVTIREIPLGNGAY